jgi:transposase
MRTRTFRLSEDQASELQAAYLHCRDADTRTRYQGVRLYGLGYAAEQIKDICACSTRSLLNWRRAQRLGGNRARLRPEQIEHLQNQLHRYTPAQLLGRDACSTDGQCWTVRELAKLVERDYGGTYLQASVMRVWAPIAQTPVVKADPGRDDTHFYGALNLKTGEQVVLGSERMNAQVSARFLTRLLLAYPDKPLLLLWDRAPRHRGPAIRTILEAHRRLGVLWLPAGSPELNPQEHVPKAPRQAVSHNHTRSKLAELAQAFETHLTTTRFACALLEKHGYNSLCPRFK